MRPLFRSVPALLLLALPLAAADPKPTAAPKAAATKPEAKPAAKAEAKAEAKSEAKPEAKPAVVDPAEKEKTFYALGAAIARSVTPFSLTQEELKHVEEGLADAVLNRPAKVKVEDYLPKLQELARERMAAAGEKEKAAGAAFAEKAAAEPGAVKKPSGLVYKEVSAGTGASPKATDKVKVHYTGKLTDGTVFDSSVERGQPAEFPLNGVIPCWTEGVQMMKVGGKARLLCPSAIAYGDNGAPPKIKPGATLVFDVELLAIENPPAPAPAAAPVPAPAPATGTAPAPSPAPKKP